MSNCPERAERVDACFGIATDSIIHLTFGIRRSQRDGKKVGTPGSSRARSNGPGLLFGRDYRCRVSHSRAMRFSADAAFWSRGARWVQP